MQAIFTPKIGHDVAYIPKWKKEMLSQKICRINEKRRSNMRKQGHRARTKKIANN